MSSTATTTASADTSTDTIYVQPTEKPLSEDTYTKLFTAFIDSKPGLKKFYDSTKLAEKVTEAKTMGDKLMADGCGSECALHLSLLTLYDIVMLIDDSSSMDYPENVGRKKTLKKTLEEITKIYDLANATGILSVRFINHKQGKKNVTNKKVEDLFHGRIYTGFTMIGTALEKKVLKKFVLDEPNMKKPLLVMTVTDGMIEGEQVGKLKHVIKKCIETMKSDESRADESVAFHFCRVGDDDGAMEMLKHLDNCDEIGQYVDCLPVDKPLEALEDVGLKWGILTKLLIGALDPNIDAMEVELGEEGIEPIILSASINPDEDDEDED